MWMGVRAERGLIKMRSRMRSCDHVIVRPFEPYVVESLETLTFETETETPTHETETRSSSRP